MGKIIITSGDLAKNVFQLHGAAADGSVMFRKTLSRMDSWRVGHCSPKGWNPESLGYE